MFATHSWLPAVVPADATRFRVSDSDLAYTLAGAGAQLVQSDPDVEIAPAEALEGKAPVAIVQVDGALDVARRRAGQAARRIATSAGVRVRVAETRAALRRRGYSRVTVLLWDRDHAIRVPELAPRGRLALAERFPRRALVVAGRGPREPTALQRAIAAAAREAGTRLDPSWPIPRAASVVLLADAGVLRVAIGPGGDRIDAQKAVLAALTAAGAPRHVAERVPRLLADGRTGMVRWSLEQRLPGRPAGAGADDALMGECHAFLLALHGLDGAGARIPAAAFADVVAGVLDPEPASALRDVAQRLDEVLADAPAGFAHGDFCTTNLLVAGGRLAGVIDWDQAGGPRLPFLDLLHLHLLAVSRAGVYDWGPAVVRHLLSDPHRVSELAGAYFRSLGRAPSPEQLRAYVGAYWLEQVAQQLGAYLDRRRDARWIERSVAHVLPRVATALTSRRGVRPR